MTKKPAKTEERDYPNYAQLVVLDDYLIHADHFDPEVLAKADLPPGVFIQLIPDDDSKQNILNWARGHEELKTAYVLKKNELHLSLVNTPKAIAKQEPAKCNFVVPRANLFPELWKVRDGTILVIKVSDPKIVKRRLLRMSQSGIKEDRLNTSKLHVTVAKNVKDLHTVKPFDFDITFNLETWETSKD